MVATERKILSAERLMRLGPVSLLSVVELECRMWLAYHSRTLKSWRLKNGDRRLATAPDRDETTTLLGENARFSKDRRSV